MEGDPGLCRQPGVGQCLDRAPAGKERLDTGGQDRVFDDPGRKNRRRLCEQTEKQETERFLRHDGQHDQEAVSGVSPEGDD